MTKYNYLEAVKEDVKNYIDSEINFTDFDSLEELEEKLNDELWIEDSVTGNASGSYYCNAYKAEESIIFETVHHPRRSLHPVPGGS